MSKHLVLLPGWGLGVVPLQILAEQLDAALPQLTVQIQPLPDVRGKSTEALIALLDQQLPSDCWLMGWSLGGMLATALAAYRQSACAGLISYASNPCFVARENAAATCCLLFCCCPENSSMLTTQNKVGNALG